MGLSGLVGARAASGLEDLLTRQLLEAKQAEAVRAQQMEEALRGQQIDVQRRQVDVQRQRLEAEQAHQAAMDEQAGIDALRKGQDRTEARLSRVQGEQDQMDAKSELDTLIAALDPRQQTVVKLGGKLSIKDMQTSEERQAEDNAAVNRAGRIADAQASAAARYREPKEPKGANATPTDTGASDIAAEVARLATALKGHKGMKSAFGSIDAAIPSVRQDTVDAEALRNSLMSTLTLNNIGKLKGVLSDRDMQVLREASTSLNPRMGDAAAAAELERIIQTAGRAGAPAPAASHGPAVGEQRVIKGRPAVWDGKGWVAK